MFEAHIICRFSTQDKEDASIDRQKERCLEVAKGLGCVQENVKIIANDNLSGGLPWDKRIDLQELEKDIKDGQCKRVIVYRFDRLSRDFEVSGRLLNLLSSHSIELYDDGGKLDYQSASGQAFFGMKAVFAGLERAMIKDRTYAGRKQKAKSGLYVGGTIPLGYVLDVEKCLPSGEPNPNYRKLKPYPPHAEIVKEIFNRLKSDGCSPFLLALALRREGRVIPEFDPSVRDIMKGKKGLKEAARVGDSYRITPKMIKRMATNSVYLGIWNWGKDISAGNNHEPIIDEDTFRTVNKQVTRRYIRKGRSAYTEPLTLSGLLFCRQHGTPVVSHSDRNRYSCSSAYHRGAEPRSHFCITSYVLDEPISEYIVKQCSYPRYSDEVLGRIEEDREGWMTRMADIQKSKKSLLQEIENLKNGLALVRTPEEVTYFLDGIDTRRKSLARLDREEHQPKKSILGADEVALVRDFLSNLFVHWDELPNTLKNRFLRLIVERIEIDYRRTDNIVEVIIHWQGGKTQCIEINYHTSCHSSWTDLSWNSKDERLLAELWDTESLEKITDVFPGRSWLAIKSKAHRMGLRNNRLNLRKVKQPTWSGQEESLVKDMYQDKLSILDVARITGRSQRAIYEKAIRMNLRVPDKRRLKVSWGNKDLLPSNDMYPESR